MSEQKKPVKKNSKKKERAGPPVDRRALEKTLSDIGRHMRDKDFSSPEEANVFLNSLLRSGQLKEAPPRTPLEEAQDVMYKAWDSTGPARVRLARKALKISPDCADAYVLLAEETTEELQEKLDLYEKGVQAGERALGAKMFEEERGHFWGITETRPYMRARLGLAECLWWLERDEEAIEHYQEMLLLNSGDNQGVRYLLIHCLLEHGDHENAATLLKQFEEDNTAVWLYSRAILMYRRGGSSPAATVSLQEALTNNPYVSTYLLGKKRLPKLLPEYIQLGQESEAIAYAVDALPIWLETIGALAWLQKSVFNRN
jgi:tetratricopeptide (TPR) repeat protein